MSCRLTVFKLTFVFSLLGAWAVCAPLATAQDETLTGWFSFTVADYPTESGLASEITYTLTKDSGERHELLIDIALMQPLGGPVTLNRKRVTVEGEWEHGPVWFRVRSIELTSSSPAASSGRTSASVSSAQTTVTGSQAWVTILCRFGDATDVTPYPVSFYEGMMGAAYPGLVHYWREVSDGNLSNLNGSVVVGWYNLPHPQSYYEGADRYDTGKILEDCTAAADADVFFPDFDGINLAFNRDFDSSNRLYGAARGGGNFMTLDGRRRFWGVTWLPEGRHESQATWAHEMGHALGLLHSSGPYDETYDSHWDVMSGGRSFAPYPGYGSLGGHTIAYHKDHLGWIPPERKYVAAPNTTRTITLERLAQPDAEGYLMAQIPIGESPTDFYTYHLYRFSFLLLSSLRTGAGRGQCPGSGDGRLRLVRYKQCRLDSGDIRGNGERRRQGPLHGSGQPRPHCQDRHPHYRGVDVHGDSGRSA